MLDKDRLGAAIWTKVKSIGGPYTPAIGSPEDAQGLSLWKSIADEIIKEFKNNGQVPVAPGSFTVSGTPVSGTGQGTIT